MKIRILAFIFGSLLSIYAVGQTELPLVLKTKTGNLEGTLTMPLGLFPFPVALIIAGSGPTDRDGNNAMMKNNSLKMLAEELAKKGVATLRYDKRGVGQSASAIVSEKDLRFETYVNDALEWIKVLKNDNSFNQIAVIGHSEGSLIGMLVSQDMQVHKFVSIAGAGSPANEIIREQMKDQPAFFADQSKLILDELEKGKTMDNVPPILNSLFRPNIQPYLISWFQYNPCLELAKLKKPVLVIQGTNDIQVSVDQAKKLHEAKPNSKLLLIDGMNHIMKNAEADRTKNILTYRQPDLPINEQLVNAVADFILTR